MNEIFKVVLSLSFSGSVLILAILACNTLLRNSLSKRWQYYIWLVVVIRLLLPFTPEQGVLSALWERNEPVQSLPVQIQETQQSPEPATVPAEPPAEFQPPALNEKANPQTPEIWRDVWSFVQHYAWTLWLAVSIGLLIRKVTLYQSFVKYLRAGESAEEDLDTLNSFAGLCEELGVNRPIELYTNRLIASPLMLGFTKPSVVLPALPKDDASFRHICLHELTHFKRMDIYYKWLLQLALCLHWFNPLVHLMVREAGRACELSCDEAVLRTLGTQQRTEYGDTLLESLKTPGTYREGLAALTLNESASSLKERLDAIMKYNKPSKGMVVVAVVLAVLLFTGGYALGAYSGKAEPTMQEENSGLSPEGLPVMSAYNREIYETYISKFAVTGLFRADFTPEDPSALIANGGSIMRSVFNVMLDEPLTDIPEAIPASQVVELLGAKLPVNEWIIEAAFADVYDEAAKTYEMYGGLGGGPSTPIVTGSSRQNDLLTIYYTWYDGDPSSDEFRYKEGDKGVLIIRLDKEDYQFVSNKVIPSDTPLNEVTQPEGYSEYTFYARTLMEQARSVFSWYYNETPYDTLWIAPESPALELDGSYYRKVVRFQSMDELKAATEAVFTKEFCEANFYPLFDVGKFKVIDGALYVGDQGGISEGATTPPKEYVLRSMEEYKVVLTAICEGPDPNADNPSNVPLIDYSFELVLHKVLSQTEDMSPIDCWRADSYYSYNADGFQGDLQPYK